MAVFAVFTYVVKLDRMNEQMAFVADFKAWIKKRPDLFKGMKAWTVYSKLAGGKFGEFVEIAEYENLTELEKNYAAVMQDKEYLTKHYPTMVGLFVPGTLGMEIWNSVP